MQRRDFVKLAGLTGLTLASPFGWQNMSRAQAATTYDGKFFALVNASGGWDPTSFCDPKGQISEEEENPMNKSYFRDDIQTAGNIPYAPVGITDDSHMSNADFFTKFSSSLLVVNGVDTSTNGHDSGLRHVWSGKLAEGHPAFGALVAADKARAAPMAFISNGGYDLTQGLVAPTRAGNTSVFARVAFPHRMDTNNDEVLYHTQGTIDRIKAAQADRLERAMAKQQLPRRMAALNTLHVARSGENEIAKLTEFLPEQLDNGANRLRRQAQLALASYKAGITVAATLSTGGFDTHGNHDASHIPNLCRIWDGVNFLMEEAERLNIVDKIVVVIGSDFGRTPGYNDSNGKDHWSISSMMMMGPGIRGNRVIGATDERHHPKTINPSTLAVDDLGIRITPGQVHLQLRKLAEVNGTELDAAYPLREDDLDLFT
ncbi:MAG: DUF1501 domain-containing protein [Deltaproteobacteria bacterium]|nr:DUF1501 domain-containing protein [Deltaproteobacteria bacterium]